MCEDIFGDGNYNLELFQYALEKIFEEERKQKEEEEREIESRTPKSILVGINKKIFFYEISVRWSNSIFNRCSRFPILFIFIKFNWELF